MSTNVVTSPIVSLAAGTAVGATGTAIPIERFTNTASAWISTTGTPATCTVTTDASFDGGSTWYALGTSGALSTVLYSSVANVATAAGATHVRARIATLTGGTSPTVTVQYTTRYESS